HVDLGRTAIQPERVQQRSVPVSPHFSWRVGVGIVAHVHHLFVRWLCPRQPLAVHVVSPEEMIGDDGLRWVDDGNNAIERERFVALEVEHRRYRFRERPTDTVGAEGGGIRNRRRIRSMTAGARRRHAYDNERTTDHHPNHRPTYPNHRYT